MKKNDIYLALRKAMNLYDTPHSDLMKLKVVRPLLLYIV